MTRRQSPPPRAPRARFSVEQVRDTLRQLIEQNAGIPPTSVRDDSTIDGDLAMDSMSFVSLQVAVEETFDIRCDAEDFEACNRFDAIAALIHERTAAPAPKRLTGAPARPKAKKKR